jgi:hypothetical protein
MQIAQGTSNHVASGNENLGKAVKHKPKKVKIFTASDQLFEALLLGDELCTKTMRLSRARRDTIELWTIYGERKDGTQIRLGIFDLTNLLRKS